MSRMSAPGFASGQISEYLLCGPAVTGKAEMYNIFSDLIAIGIPNLPDKIPDSVFLRKIGIDLYGTEINQRIPVNGSEICLIHITPSML